VWQLSVLSSPPFVNPLQRGNVMSIPYTPQAFESHIRQCIEMFMDANAIPRSEFDPIFVARMVRCMMVSYHKYGRVAEAYPDKFDALADIRARVSKYRETGDFWFLVDVGNFAMIEVMHPKTDRSRINNPEPHWGRNEDDTSPGRTNAETRNLEQTDNQGNRLGGDGFLHLPADEPGRGL